MVMAMADVWRGGSGTGSGSVMDCHRPAVCGGDIATTGVVICGAEVGGRGVTTGLARSKSALWWGSCVHVGNVAVDRRGGKAKSLRHGSWRGRRGAVVLSCMWRGGGEDLRGEVRGALHALEKQDEKKKKKKREKKNISCLLGRSPARRQPPLHDECGEERRRRALGLRKGGGGLHSRRSPQTSEVWVSSLRTAGVVVDP
ncbi:hypothetical protein H4582DRAFT_2134816 [Lactarius indigo]|nr:hypothetical protein H4582DRAFT_2134816 [Lactarius indigo]